MLSLLDPRIWLAALLAVALSSGAGYFKGRSDGRQISEAKHLQATQRANADALRVSEIRQRNVDAAARDAAAREARLRADARDARSERDGLRGDLDATKRYAATSRAAAERAVAVATGLLEQCSNSYLDMAESAARADSEARELRASWPK